jgi:LmbE family N-acetylglucosaminyl deacetylase
MAIREAELSASLGVIGVTEHHYLGYADGGCADVPDDEAVAKVAAIIDEVQPDTILSFGPHGGTGHTDHMATCRWATKAVAAVGDSAPRLLYMTKTRRWIDEFFAGIDRSSVMMVEDMELEVTAEDELAVWYECEGDVLTRKLAAMRAQASQIEPLVEMVGGPDRFIEVLRDEFFREPTADELRA